MSLQHAHIMDDTREKRFESRNPLFINFENQNKIKSRRKVSFRASVIFSTQADSLFECVLSHTDSTFGTKQKAKMLISPFNGRY